MALRAKAKRAIQNGVDNLKPFKCGNVRGVVEPLTQGRLPYDLWQHINKVYVRGELEYILYSYGTPMAWKVKGMTNWVFPGITYSVTTNNHQNIMRTAIANPGFYKDVKW